MASNSIHFKLYNKPWEIKVLNVKKLIFVQKWQKNGQLHLFALSAS